MAVPVNWVSKLAVMINNDFFSVVEELQKALSFAEEQMESVKVHHRFLRRVVDLFRFLLAEGT